MSPDPRIVRTRARVLDAAWDLLQQVGFDGVTVDLVSERSGVARSTLYRHWRTKEEILRDAFADQASDTAQPPPGADGLSALVAYARAFATGLVGLWGRAAVSLSASAWDDPEQRRVQQVFVQGTRRDLLAVVVRGCETGELPAGLDGEQAVDRLVEQVVAPLFYRYQFTEAPATADDAARLARTAWALLAQPKE